MKKYLIILGILCAGTYTQAQSIYVQGGVNFANISSNNDGDVEDNHSLTSFNVGVMSRFGLSEFIDLEAGLLFTGKGAKAETYFNGGEDYIKAKFNPYYIELPVNLLVNIPMAATENKLFAYAGPYVAMGVGGKSKLSTKLGPLETETESNIEFNDDDPTTSGQEDAAYDRLKRFDFGANFGAGFQISRFIIKANYGLGFAKINSTAEDNDSNDKNKYRTWSISLGIPLGN